MLYSENIHKYVSVACGEAWEDSERAGDGRGTEGGEKERGGEREREGGREGNLFVVGLGSLLEGLHEPLQPIVQALARLGRAGQHGPLASV
jgi:hypothetical protein